MKNTEVSSKLESYKANELQRWYETNPWAASRNIEPAMWQALTNTLYPGAKPESVLMAVDYCRARELDVMLKPVHLVAMNVKDQQSGRYEWRDVPMPGIGLYRIQADRSGSYAGSDEPEFGPMVTQEFTDKNGKTVTHTFPEWCKVTVYKMIKDRIVAFTAKEYWVENYATDSGKSDAPNSMWAKRCRGQLAKCAEAQALRKAWPEIGSEPTAEEMEGKTIERNITPMPAEAPHAEEKRAIDPKAAHSAQRTAEPQQADEAPESDKDYFDIDLGEPEPQEPGIHGELLDQIFDAKTEDELNRIGKLISQHAGNGTVTLEQVNVLRGAYKQAKQELGHART